MDELDQLTIREVQARVLRNKLQKGFPVGNVDFDINKIGEELQELIIAHALGVGSVPEELADIVIMVFGLAAGLDISMEEAILKKMIKNEKRIISKNSDGTFNKTEGPAT